MEKKLNQNLANREILINAIEQEIVGPSDINNATKLLNTTGNTKFESFDDLNTNYYWLSSSLKEEVIQRDSPSRRYAAGMLYPVQLQREDADVTSEEIIADKKIDENQSGFYDELDKQNDDIVEETGLEDISPKIQQQEFMPSSMGVSFCL